MNSGTLERLFFLKSRIQTKIFTAFLGWIPTSVGTIIRGLIYPAFFKKMGRSVKIYRDVSFNQTRCVEIGGGTIIRRGFELIVEANNKVKIGDRSMFERDVQILALGEGSKLEIGEENHIARGVNLTVQPGGSIELGDNVYMGCYSCISSYGKTKIGKDCLIASHCAIYGHDHVFEDLNRPIREQGIRIKKGITIEDDCWLGSGVKIIDGVTIGKGSVIGAGAVVTKNIPPYSIAVGVPAKVIKKRTDCKIAIA